MTTRDMTVDAEKAREGAGAVAMLVQIAGRFNSSIYIENGTSRANAKSIMGMMNMTLQGGDTIRVTADGTDERSAVAKIEEFVTNRA